MWEFCFEIRGGVFLVQVPPALGTTAATTAIIAIYLVKTSVSSSQTRPPTPGSGLFEASVSIYICVYIR